LANDKKYTISFKSYHNERVKPVLFHGKEMHPLYLQVTFDRQSIYFKSYFFDLLSAPRYSLRHITGNRNPVINEVKEKEEKLVNYIIEKNAGNFSLELFRQQYNYYSRDIISELEKGFFEYLETFFADEGYSLLPVILHNSSKHISCGVLLEDFKSSFKPALYSKMMENAVYYAPPFIPVAGFAAQYLKDRLITFSVYEWEEPTIKVLFDNFLKKNHPSYNPATIARYVQQLIR